MKRCSIVDLGLGLGLGLRFGTVGTDLDILAMSLPEVVTTGERGMTPLSAACGQPHHRMVLTAWVDQMERHLPPYLAPRYSAPSLRGPRHAAPRCLTTNGEHELRPANEVNDQDGGPKPSFPSSCPRAVVQDQQSHHVTGSGQNKTCGCPGTRSKGIILFGLGS